MRDALVERALDLGFASRLNKVGLLLYATVRPPCSGRAMVTNLAKTSRGGAKTIVMSVFCDVTLTRHCGYAGIHADRRPETNAQQRLVELPHVMGPTRRALYCVRAARAGRKAGKRTRACMQSEEKGVSEEDAQPLTYWMADLVAPSLAFVQDMAAWELGAARVCNTAACFSMRIRVLACKRRASRTPRTACLVQRAFVRAARMVCFAPHAPRASCRRPASDVRRGAAGGPRGRPARGRASGVQSH